MVSRAISAPDELRTPEKTTEECPDDLFQQIAELLSCEARRLRRRRVHLGELVAPMPGTTRIDDGTAVGEVALGLALRLDARIERRAPGIVDDVDRGRRIGARQHRPDQFL